MAYDQRLAARVKTWADKHPGIAVKAMFGGLCYLVGGNMLGGVKDTNLLLRLGPGGATHIGKPHILPFPTWARPMAGYLQVEPAGCATDASLATWLDQAHAFVSSLPPKDTAAPPAAPAKPAPARRPAARTAAKAKPETARRAKAKPQTARRAKAKPVTAKRAKAKPATAKRAKAKPAKAKRR